MHDLMFEWKFTTELLNDGKACCMLRQTRRSLTYVAIQKQELELIEVSKLL